MRSGHDQAMTRARAGASGRVRGRAFRPGAEGLEGRALMASLTVGPLTNTTRLPGADMEVNIAVNPTNPSNVFLTTIGGAAGQVASVSFDGGTTWTSRIMSDGSDGTPDACCDASMAFDSFGNLFMTYLSASIETVVVLSTDGGQTFSNVANMGGSDQPTLVVGPGNVPGSQSVWVVRNFQGGQWVRGALVTGLGQVGAFGADQYAPDSDLNIGGNFGDITVGPNGAVAIAYQNSASGEGPDTIFGNVDPDGLGPLGFGPRFTISDTNVGGFDFIPAQNRRSVDAEVSLAWDRTGGPNNGRLYAAYTDEDPNESSDTNIYVRYSDDAGQNWSGRVRANDDAGTNSQFLPKMALDATTGAIAVGWMDARNDLGQGGLGDTNGIANDEAMFYVTASVDGGLSFLANSRVSQGPSNAGSVANNGFDYGDYTGLAFHGNKIYPAYPDNSAQLAGNPDRPNFDIATATVTLVTLEVGVAGISATENTPFSGAVAVINPNDPSITAGDLAATINWGDGTPPTAGVISANGDGTFTVTGDHTYVDGGNFPLSVTVVQGGTSTTGTGTASVADRPIIGNGTTLFLDEGQPFTGVLGTFTDTDPDPTTADQYSVTITWGDDGSTSPGTVTPVPGQPNTYTITASHAFGAARIPIAVAISTLGGNTTTLQSLAIVTDSPLSATFLTGGPAPVEGTPFTAPLVRFTDADPRQLPASHYFASIDWGDGTTTPGIITADLNNPGSFLVSGDHAYDVSPNGLPYTITVTVGNFVVVDTATVPGNTAEATGSVTVTDSPITAEGFNFQAVEGVVFSQFVAIFDDTDPRVNPPTRYLATIEWGDGTQGTTEGGTPDLTVIVNTDGGYLLRGQHAYRAPGFYSYVVTISDRVGGATTTATGTVDVAAAPLSVSVIPGLQVTEGLVFGFPVAGFSTTNTLATPTDFTATIVWGDGTLTDNATITQEAGTGLFLVSADKAYTDPGTYPIQVIVTRVPGGTQVQAEGTLAVLDAPLIGSPLPLPGLVSKTPYTGLQVATVRDIDPASNPDELSATINWGDGSPTGPAALVQQADGTYRVVADHTFARSGSLTATVVVTSSKGSTTTILVPVTVAPRAYPISGTVTTPGVGGAGYTNRPAPAFTGSAQPGSTVTVYARPAAGGVLTTLATATANAQGVWTTNAGASLADGSYAIFASSIDTTGDVSSPLTQLQPSPSVGALVVDTRGPQVSNVVISATTGEIRISLTDALAGLWKGGLDNPGNYRLTILGPGLNRTLAVSGLTIAPVAPNTQQTATLTFGGLQRLKRGSYVLQLSAQGLTDLASNPLDERYFLPFPGLYTRSGQDFVARFTTDGTNASQLMPYVPAPEIVAARQYNQWIAARLRRRS